jgi:hypothetical protein
LYKPAGLDSGLRRNDAFKHRMIKIFYFGESSM